MCKHLWDRIVENDTYPIKSSALPKHLLCGLLFLKDYNFEAINAGIAGVNKKPFVSGAGNLYTNCQN